MGHNVQQSIIIYQHVNIERKTIDYNKSKNPEHVSYTENNNK